MEAGLKLESPSALLLGLEANAQLSNAQKAGHCRRCALLGPALAAKGSLRGCVQQLVGAEQPASPAVAWRSVPVPGDATEFQVLEMLARVRSCLDALLACSSIASGLWKPWSAGLPIQLGCILLLQTSGQIRLGPLVFRVHRLQNWRRREPAGFALAVSRAPPRLRSSQRTQTARLNRWRSQAPLGLMPTLLRRVGPVRRSAQRQGHCVDVRAGGEVEETTDSKSFTSERT